MHRLEINDISTPPRWFEIAEGELGVREVRGRRHNDRVLQYLQTALNIGKWGRERDETAWCAAFVNWCLKQAGEEGTGSALARSFVNWGVPCDDRLGAICVIKYKGHADANTGSRAGFHVGFLVRVTSHSYRILGGNQRDEVSYRNFPKRSYELIALRWPERHET